MPDTLFLETRHGLPTDLASQALDDLLGRLARQDRPRLVLHAHGGLVSADAGETSADYIDETFRSLDGWERAYLIWHTGFFEEIIPGVRGVLTDALAPSLIAQVKPLAAEWVTADGRAGDDADPPIADPEVILARLRDAGIADGGGRIFEAPVRDAIAARLAADPAFTGVTEQMAGVVRGERSPAGADPAAAWDNLDIQVRQAVLARSDKSVQATADALRSEIADRLGGAAVRIILRFLAGRDHGLQATVVEEVGRALYLGAFGAFVWGNMKADAAAHFASPSALGTRLLEGLDAISRTKTVELAVVGHSAGAVLALRLLEHAKLAATKIRLSLVFWAAAATQALAVEAFNAPGPQGMPARFALLSLSDAAEKADKLDGKVPGNPYPRSLPYLISGVLEPECPLGDAPILGMERHRLIDPARLLPNEQNDRAQVDALLSHFSHAAWTCPCGDDCSAATHGSFSCDRITHLTTVHLVGGAVLPEPHCPGAI